MSTCQRVCTFQCQHVSKPACQRVSTFAYRHVTMLARQPSHMSARRRHASMSAVSSSRSVCVSISVPARLHIGMSACKLVSNLSVGHRDWTFAYRYVRMSASAYPQGVSISASASTPTCQHVKMSASQSVFKPVYHHVSVSACQVVSVSASQCQPTSTSTCENVGMSGCERFISVNVSLSHCLGVSACQHVSVFNYNMSSEKTSPKNPEDYNCIVTTVLNVLHPF